MEEAVTTISNSRNPEDLEVHSDIGDNSDVNPDYHPSPWITTALLKIGATGTVEPDREHHKVRPHKIIEEVKNTVRNHIQQFPVMHSHYTVCNICTAYEQGSETIKHKMKQKHDSHINNKEAVRSLKDLDKDLATNNKTVCVACFDLQKVLITPMYEISAFKTPDRPRRPTDP
ncbi:hypothetical protein ILUMI_11098 [Ignelater luminosus]|uniref:Uncharacterized protein n=1 Tax=Ignelater luminosus TaxID=2038154 RepID=A0A8K0CZ33_IGNLU|nr:hypothetical protein ILUMI_11098 [Ignelater luminosus]